MCIIVHNEVHKKTHKILNTIKRDCSGGLFIFCQWHTHAQLSRPITLIACQLICRAIAFTHDSEVLNTRSVEVYLLTASVVLENHLEGPFVRCKRSFISLKDNQSALFVLRSLSLVAVNQLARSVRCLL